MSKKTENLGLFMNWPMELAYYWPVPKNKGLGYFRFKLVLEITVVLSFSFALV